jgi:glycopeptide antibiotics resistance protein
MQLKSNLYYLAKLTKNLLVLKKISLGVAFSWAAVILYVCLIRISEVPTIKIANFDKYIHAFFYFVFSTLWFFALRLYFKKWSRNQVLGVVFLMSLLFGIAIELFQAFFTTYRSGDIADVFANTAGTLLALVSISILVKKSF